MNGQNVAYLRVSTRRQKTDRQLSEREQRIATELCMTEEQQLDYLKDRMDKVFVDHWSGKTRERPALRECLSYLRDGDTLHVHSLDRLSRKLVDIEAIVNELNGKGVTVKFHREGWTFLPKETNPMAIAMRQMLGCFAEYQRATIVLNTLEGIAEKRYEREQAGDVGSNGLGRWGPKPKIKPDMLARALEMIEAGTPKAQVAKALGVGRTTLYEALKLQSCNT